MNVLTIDFETYYDKDYSLRNMTTIEYIKDPRFQVLMMSYKFNDMPTDNLIGEANIQQFLNTIDWNTTVINAQNTQFDGTILRERFGVVARYYADTMAMARVTGAHIFEGASLRAIANTLKRAGIPVKDKGTEVESASGKSVYYDASCKVYYLADRPAVTDHDVRRGAYLLDQYVSYCNNDVDLAYQAFLYFSTMITPEEMQYGDLILKAYILPSTYLDLGIIQTEIARIEQRDKERATAMADKYFDGNIARLRATCRSAVKFTDFLESVGGVRLSQHPSFTEDELLEQGIARFIIPERYSEKKKIVEPCYSKSYSGMMDMCDHPDDDIAILFRTKLDMTSSIELSRAKRFENIAKLNCGFGFPYIVSGAHTHRLGGTDRLNLQNLSSGRKKGQSKALKQSITAPANHKIVVFDSSQIELRTGAFIAQDNFLLEMFPNGKDPYSELAANIYGGDPKEIKMRAKADEMPYLMYRQVGKSAELSCIYGTGKYGFMNYLKINGVDMPEDDCGRIVAVYRQTHPTVVATWSQCEKALASMMAGGSGYFGGPKGDLFYFTGTRNLHGVNVPGIRLPDGNWLNYRDLRWEERVLSDGTQKRNIAYTGMKEGRIKTIYTYGAKVFENCIAEDTEVLTDRGWIKIQDVKNDDLIYDGDNFVQHNGLINKGEQQCVQLNNVWLTADHEVLTETGWHSAEYILETGLNLKGVN